MLTFQNFLDEGLFSWLKDSLRRISSEIKSILTRLKLGDKVKISLKHSQHLKENAAGGGGNLIRDVGVVAEWITGAEIFDLLDKYNKANNVGIKYNPQNRQNIRKIASQQLKRIHGIYSDAKKPTWDGFYTDAKGNRKNVMGSDFQNKDPKVIQSRGNYLLKMMPTLREKCKSSASAIFNMAIENLNDQNLTEWDIECTGQSDGGKESTTDIVIHKMEKGKVANQFEVSLKTSLGKPEETRGKSTNPLVIIGKLLGLGMPGHKNYGQLLDSFPVNQYGKEVESVVKEVKGLLDEWHATEGKGSRGKKELWHAFVKERTGYDAIEMGAHTWIRLLHAFSEKHKVEFVEQLFELLDLKADSPVLVATGQTNKGEVVTAIKSPSKEVLTEWNKAMRKIELRLDYDPNKRIGSSAMKWVFSINGIELPAIGAQIYASPEGGLQFKAKANVLIPREEIEKTLETKFGLKI